MKPRLNTLKVHFQDIEHIVAPSLIAVNIKKN